MLKLELLKAKKCTGLKDKANKRKVNPQQTVFHLLINRTNAKTYLLVYNAFHKEPYVLPTLYCHRRKMEQNTCLKFQMVIKDDKDPKNKPIKFLLSTTLIKKKIRSKIT
jgi:hypothetical protein